MIELFRSIWESISAFLGFISNSIHLIVDQFKLSSKIFLYFSGYWYLIPGFLLYFAVMFTIIFIVNRITLGRN